MILALLLALIPRIEIVAANDARVTYRELLPRRVALDSNTRTYHFKGCPQVRQGEEWVSPAAATLRGFHRHTCVGGDEYVTKTEARAPRDSAHIGVLFIGNSLTYFNEMPKMTSAIATNERRPLLVEQVTMSGASLEDLWLQTDAPTRIWEEHWDYVILQERSGRAAMDLGERFHQYLRRFADEARKSGATPILFMTWSPGNEQFFRSAAERDKVRLLPVGRAWRREFDWDGIHPNLFGSYLIACSVYAMVYDKPPVGLRSDFRDLADKSEFYDAPLLQQTLNQEQANAIGRAAWRACHPERSEGPGGKGGTAVAPPAHTGPSLRSG